MYNLHIKFQKISTSYFLNNFITNYTEKKKTYIILKKRIISKRIQQYPE